jgi:hypothetical protein
MTIANLTADKIERLNQALPVFYELGIGNLIQNLITEANSETGEIPAALANGDIFVGNSSNVPAAVAVTGDITLTDLGVATIGAGKVSSGKMALFVSTLQTGSGGAQNIAHGLGVTPTTVLLIPASVPATGGLATSFTKGSTNVVATVTNGATYYVVAIA